MKILEYILAALAVVFGLAVLVLANYGVWAGVNLVDEGVAALCTSVALGGAAVLVHDGRKKA